MRWGYIFVLAIAIFIAGCCTTGDPREGGLWGWCEEKAIERLEKLKAELNQLIAQTDDCNRRIYHDKALLKKLNNEVEELRIEVNELEKLRTDNQKLEAALNAKRDRIKWLKAEINRLLEIAAK